MFDQAQVTTTLAVTDLHRAREFYGKRLGLHEVKRSTPLKEEAIYQVGNQHICLYQRPTPSGSTATVCSFGVKDVEATVKTLQKSGVRFEEYDMPEMGIKTKDGIAAMGEFRSAWFKDPDGNILAIDNMLLVGTRPDAKTAVVKAH